jgi:dethiobiotin synthetase
LRGCFVTGTDTGAGKTVLAAALCAAMQASGERVAAYKPVVTGVGAGDDPSRGDPNRSDTGDGDRDGREPSGSWPPDHELLAAVTGVSPHEVCARTFAPAVSPHLAAELASTTIALGDLVAAAHAATAGADVLVVEGVGGLLVPLSESHSIRDLAVALGLPLVVAARPDLGTINHSLLTIEAARNAGLDVRAVVLTPWPAEPTVMQRSNRATIARLGGVDVGTLAPVGAASELASAGAVLPWASWLGCLAISRGSRTIDE